MGIKITTFVGSANINSMTKKIINELVSALSSKINDSIVVKEYDANMQVTQCRGCSQCFTTNLCSLDKFDKVQDLKKDYLSSDIIIWGTPVYANNVSSSFKAMIDRISYWCHEFRFAGKRAIIVVTTDNSGSEKCLNYLYEILSFLGASDIQVLSYQKKNDSIDLLHKNIMNITDEMSYYINNNEKKTTNDFSERAFENFKKIYKEQIDESAEKKYWVQSGLIDSDTLYDYINNNFISLNYFTK